MSDSITRTTIWNRELTKLYDNDTDTGMPSEVLCGYWESPWSDEEVSLAFTQVKELREKEQTMNLGQGESLDELDRRLRCIGNDQSFHMDMI